MKKGFTLAELLGVICVLATISLVTVPVVTDSLQKYKASACETQLNQIIKAAEAYGADHINALPSEVCNGSNDNICKIRVSLDDLIKNKYIDEVKNPMTKEKFDSKKVNIEIRKVSKKYSYILDEDTRKSCEIKEDNGNL